GRETIYQKLRPDIRREIGHLMTSTLPNRSVEYMDNRISRYSMKMGKCEITGVDLTAADVHCHHYVPRSFGGSDQFHNLRILHWKVHQLIHYTNKEMIDELRPRFHLTWSMITKINRYREKCHLGPI